ncbi:MAG: ribonuclease P protein component [Deltaproteobacteria bacterium]|nr:ribonuclease P protein component [Deltaproteobacteria bacterium]
MHRFPKTARLLKQAEFDGLKSGSRSKGSRFLVLRWKSKEKRRLGVVVSKKVGKAHKRNLIKRIIREEFRLHPDCFPAGDVVVIARPPLGLLQREDILGCLRECLKK